ncbi:MAG TPA: LysE family transporter [Anaeromyxobacteraceae bacterium]|nr:LysE family transporter [Anaeromyxobacteraceae bacterium]
MIPFAQGATLGLSGALSPGPLQAYMLSQAAKRGPWRTLPIALVPLVTDPIIITTVLLVLSRVPPVFLRALQLGGGLFVIWLGANGLRSMFRPPAAAAAAHEPPIGFVRAALVNLTNPNAWIWWSVAGGAALASAWRASPGQGLAYLGGFYFCLVGGNAALVVLFGEVGRLGPRSARALAAVSSLLLLVFGAYQLVTGLRG